MIVITITHRLTFNLETLLILNILRLEKSSISYRDHTCHMSHVSHTCQSHMSHVTCQAYMSHVTCQAHVFP